MRGAGGVINIIRKHGVRKEPVTLTPNSVYTVINGFEIPRVFYSPKYDEQKQETFVPDFRSTIFWKPDIRIEKGTATKVDFYNADEAGTIKIIVEGVTAEGTPVTGRLSYSVR
jgi:hypothetical protein